MTSYDVAEPKNLGRFTFTALGVTSKDILAGAADRFNGYMDFADRHDDLPSESERKVARLMHEGIFHSGMGTDDF